MSEGLVYLRAGNLKLVRHSDGATFLQPGAIESIQEKNSLQTATLKNGNSSYDFELVTGKEGGIDVKFSSFFPHIYAALIGATYKSDQTLGLQRILSDSIPTASPFVIDVSEEGTVSADFVPVIHDAADSPYVKVSSDPVVGQFSASGNVFTFSSANAGAALKMNFEITTTLDQMEILDEANMPVFEMTVSGEAANVDDQGVTKKDATIFDAVKLSGEASKPPRSKDPAGWSVSMKLAQPRAGKKPVDYRIES